MSGALRELKTTYAEKSRLVLAMVQMSRGVFKCEQASGSTKSMIFRAGNRPDRIAGRTRDKGAESGRNALTLGWAATASVQWAMIGAAIRSSRCESTLPSGGAVDRK